LSQDIQTTKGELFTSEDHKLMAALIFRRFGRNEESFCNAWRRLLENNAENSEIMKLIPSASQTYSHPETPIEIIEDVADEIGGTMRSTYSGRGMYGKTCYGIDCDDSTSCIELAAAKGLKGAKTDNMGKGYIVYWPAISAD